MNTELWNKIKDFELDDYKSEYGFTCRLADENQWTIYFTEQAILEYKKFMYLAATNEEMISPSEIVDVVWHQHLIFTKSYHALGKILNKKIEHIPSTHNASQKETFVRAKQRTTQLYELNFGKQPKEFWINSSIEEAFEIEKASKNKLYFMLGLVALFVILLYPASILLRPLLVSINNPEFLIGYALFIILTFISLSIYNRYVFKSTANKYLQSRILSNLVPEELVYFKTNSLEQIVHSIVNKLVVDKHISISKDYKLRSKRVEAIHTAAENSILGYIELKSETHYPYLLKSFIEKPVIKQYTFACKHIQEKFKGSKVFSNMLLVNLFIFLTVLLFGCSRMLVGISRDKPVLFLVLILLAFIGFIVLFQKKRLIYFTRKAIPEQFKEQIIVPAQDQGEYKNTEWQYFSLGSAALALTFTPVMSYADRNKNSSSNNSCGTSGGGGDSGGGDGGSCGGGCGGCGGGD